MDSFEREAVQSHVTAHRTRPSDHCRSRLRMDQGEGETWGKKERDMGEGEGLGGAGERGRNIGSVVSQRQQQDGLHTKSTFIITLPLIFTKHDRNTADHAKPAAAAEIRNRKRQHISSCSEQRSAKGHCPWRLAHTSPLSEKRDTRNPSCRNRRASSMAARERCFSLVA